MRHSGVRVCILACSIAWGAFGQSSETTSTDGSEAQPAAVEQESAETSQPEGDSAASQDAVATNEGEPQAPAPTEEGVATSENSEAAQSADESAGEATDGSETTVEAQSKSGLASLSPQQRFQLRDVETRVDSLKEKIYRSKVRLLQLQEVVLRGAVKGSQLVLAHRNEMGSSFKLTRIQYALDGAIILNRTDSGDGDLNELEEIEVFNGSVTPGDHQLGVYLEYQGHGYGVFSYLQGYTFKLKSSYVFTAEEGKMTNILVTGYEKGKLTTKLEERPAVKYDMEVSKDLGVNVDESDESELDGEE